ncbi:MAG: hypothetical protein KIS89_04265 [Dokdonella sp.]|nr:hypothetical protein [Dokdonella sp.]
MAIFLLGVVGVRTLRAGALRGAGAALPRDLDLPALAIAPPRRISIDAAPATHVTAGCAPADILAACAAGA